jgi:hypothetical protein
MRQIIRRVRKFKFQVVKKLGNLEWRSSALLDSESWYVLTVF